MTEEWRTVAVAPSYEVSSEGRVRRIAWARNSGGGRVLRPSPRRGYPSVDLCEQGKKRTYSVHRLVAAAFLGPCPEGMEVNHIDGCKTNARASNLEYVTSAANQRHAYRAGLQSAAGERNGQAKLTQAQVDEIRSIGAYPRGSYARLGREYGVHGATIRDIVFGRTWSS